MWGGKEERHGIDLFSKKKEVLCISIEERKA